MNIATWLKLRMLEKDTNPYGLSHGIQVSHVTIGKWLNETYTPNSKNCRALAKFFDVPEEYVLTIAGHLSATGNISEPKPTYEITNPRDNDPTLLEIYHALKCLPSDQRRQVLEFVLFQLHRKDAAEPSASTTDTAAVAAAATG